MKQFQEFPVLAKAKLWRALIFVAVAGIGLPASGERGVNRRDTLAHEWLAGEFRASRVPEARARASYALLDSIIRDVARRLQPRLVKSDPDEARAALRTIDRVLAERRFFVSMPTRALMDSLTPTSAPPARGLLTPLRRKMIGQDSQSPCYPMDCDTGSVLFASIGEALRLPISIVEVPGHKFVRWNLGAGRHVNWDTNAARDYSDSDYRRGKTLTCNVAITPAEESRGKFLTNLSRGEVLAYHRNIIAELHEELGREEAAAADYRAALAARPHDSLAANNLAWLLLDKPALRNRGSVAYALELARTATSILPRNRDYQDTLARALAANGRFEEAIAAEKRGYRNGRHLRLFKRRQAY